MLTKLAFHPNRHLNLMKIYQIEILFHAIVELLIPHQRRGLCAHRYGEPAFKIKIKIIQIFIQYTYIYYINDKHKG